MASCSDTNPLTAQSDLELREICIPCPAPPVVMTSCSGQVLLWCSQIVVHCPIMLKPADFVAMHPSVEISGRIWASLCWGLDMRYGACSLGEEQCHCRGREMREMPEAKQAGSTLHTGRRCEGQSRLETIYFNNRQVL